MYLPELLRYLLSEMLHIFIDETTANDYHKTGLFGETGENPVRARRRKAQ